MRISEIFYSIQGEGASIGLPAIFLRLQVCNLTCEWCDTRYTWDINHPDYDKYQAVDLDKIIPMLSEYPCRRLIITGGEPLLHAAAILTDCSSGRADHPLPGRVTTPYEPCIDSHRV